MTFSSSFWNVGRLCLMLLLTCSTTVTTAGSTFCRTHIQANMPSAATDADGARQACCVAAKTLFDETSTLPVVPVLTSMEVYLRSSTHFDGLHSSTHFDGLRSSTHFDGLRSSTHFDGTLTFVCLAGIDKTTRRHVRFFCSRRRHDRCFFFRLRHVR